MSPTAKDKAIVMAMEKKMAPVGKGHSNDHRTAALMKWLKNKEASKKKGSVDDEAKDTKKHESSESMAMKKSEDD